MTWSPNEPVPALGSEMAVESTAFSGVSAGGGRAVRGRGGLHAAMTVPEVWTMRILLVCGLGTVAGLLLTSADRRAGGAHSGGERKAQEAERIFRAFDRRTK